MCGHDWVLNAHDNSSKFGERNPYRWLVGVSLDKVIGEIDNSYSPKGVGVIFAF